MQFKIEQIALVPKDKAKAMELLEAIGAADWHSDVVSATGEVYGAPTESKGELEFNYTAITGNELEVLHYTEGENWMHGLEGRVSHLGMHCSAEELERWRAFFEARDIDVAQELRTHEHTNPVIAGKRLYHYVIFNTRDIIGADLKFIVRKDQE